MAKPACQVVMAHPEPQVIWVHQAPQALMASPDPRDHQVHQRLKSEARRAPRVHPVHKVPLETRELQARTELQVKLVEREPQEDKVHQANQEIKDKLAHQENEEAPVQMLNIARAQPVRNLAVVAADSQVVLVVEPEEAVVKHLEHCLSLLHPKAAVVDHGLVRVAPAALVPVELEAGMVKEALAEPELELVLAALVLLVELEVLVELAATAQELALV